MFGFKGYTETLETFCLVWEDREELSHFTRLDVLVLMKIKHDNCSTKKIKVAQNTLKKSTNNKKGSLPA